MLVDFKNSFTVGFSKELTIKYLSFSPPHLNYVATLPCEIYKKIKKWRKSDIFNTITSTYL